MTAQDLLNFPAKYRLRIEDYRLLDDAGAFAAFAKTELIEGEIVCLNAQYSRHARAKSHLALELALCLRRMGSPLEAIVEVAVALAPDSMPEPDIVLTSHRGDGPVPLETVTLIVEVSDTTLATDLGRKAALYARAGVLEYWVVDLSENRCLLHMAPGAEGFAEQIDVPFGARIVSGTIEALTVETSGLT